MITEIDFKVTGEERKKLAYAIGETLGLPVKYTRTPRFDYMIGESIIQVPCRWQGTFCVQLEIRAHG